MEVPPFEPGNWLLHELIQHIAKINMASVPKESRETIFAALDNISSNSRFPFHKKTR